MPKKDGIDIFVGQASASDGFHILEYNSRWDAYFPHKIPVPLDVWGYTLQAARAFRRSWTEGKTQDEYVVRGVKSITPEMKRECFEDRFFKSSTSLGTDPIEIFPKLFRVPAPDRFPVIVEMDGYRSGRVTTVYAPSQWTRFSLSTMDWLQKMNAEFFIAWRKREE